MNDQLDISLIFYGGFVIAVVCLIFATTLTGITRSQNIYRCLFITLAFCGLFYEKGCFMAASEAGRATGGSGGDGAIDNIINVSFLIAIVWSIVLLLLAGIKKDKRDIDKK